MVVLPSPLVGSEVYSVLAQAFRDVGWTASVAPVPVGATSGSDVMAAFADAVEVVSPDLVVAHSNAGLVAPAVADGIPVVFMDAALPPATGECTMAPPGMLTHLVSLADDAGVLPPWTRWFEDADVAPLFPDVATRARIEAAMPRLPLSYFRSTVTAPTGWEGGPCAYLAFGGTYAGELARARTLGWPTTEVTGARHLHFLHDPAAVAASVLELPRRATGAAGTGSRV